MRSLELTVVRSGSGGQPQRETVTAPVTEFSTVLDLLEWAKAGPWPTLAFRYSCRSGVCGSCGVMVNGRAVLACETNAFGYLKSGLTVAPLAHLPVQRDLITDVDGFISRMKQSLAWQLPVPVDDEGGLGSATPPKGSAQHDGVGVATSGIRRQTPAELEQYRKLSECINCLLCYAACPVFTTDPEFIGPAALALAIRWNNDSRDDGEEQRLEAIAENEHGAFACTQDGSCTRVCPKGLDPKKAIGDLQRSFLM